MNLVDKIKVWQKMSIWEVSACGIPMYPKAHKSFSLIKALQDEEAEKPLAKSDELNLEKKLMEETEEPKEAEEAKGESEDSESESEQVEKSETVVAEKPETEEEEKPEEADKAVNELKGLIVKGFREAMKEVSTERGLIQTDNLQDQMSEELNKKSIGELAVMSGLFQKPAVAGSTRGFE